MKRKPTFQQRVWAYARAIYRRTGRMPDYHAIAAEIAAADLRRPH